ncbi:TIGR02646 family protein [Pseudomonas cichorii]|nr:TIGR02646 family protein [Pseudomonas cichorii]MBX8587150.1 TIGR02646 family protein [Pseudomonas cichorii]
MRHIPKKKSTYKPLHTANLSPPETSQDANFRWSKFGRYKKRLLELLLREQFSVCCYTEIQAEDYKLGYHIEHVLNKSEHPLRTFDYTNLAASVLASDDLKRLKSEGLGSAFGGHAQGKIKPINPHLFISPHLTDCERFFAYLSDGRVVPTEKLEEEDKRRAVYTIDMLNLNSQFLIHQRKRWHDEISSYIDQHLSNAQSLDEISKSQLNPVENKLRSFNSLTRQIFNRC